MNGPVIAMLALGFLWPFGDDEQRNDDTIATLDGETVEIAPAAPIPNSSELARENYRQFLELSDDDPLKAEAMRRLADLELEASEAAELAANVEAIEQAGYQNAVELYLKLLQTYPDYPRNDLVLYQLARAYESGGRQEEALLVLDELVTDWPDTVHYHEAQFRRGEMLFVLKRYGQAEEAYARLTAVGDESGFYQQSLYKLGWSRFKQAFYQESLEPFFTLLDLKLASVPDADRDDMLQGLGQAERELVADTFRVLSIGFSYTGGAAAIGKYMDRHGTPAYAHVIYRNLGDLYLEQERYEDAAAAYRAFVERDPLHPRAPLLMVQVVESYKSGGFPTLVLEAKEEFVDSYGMDTPYWQGRSREEQPEVVGYLKANLTDLAQYYHALAQDKGERADYQRAARWYRKYLDYFPGEADSAKTNFLLAEILFESGDYVAAAAEYEATAYAYAFHEKAGEAGYAALLAYREHEQTLPVAEREAWHSRYLDSALRFADTFPDHPESGPVLTTVAEDLFRQGQFDLAIGVARNVVAKMPPVAPELEKTAWRVIAHSHFDLAQYAEAETANIELRARTPAGDTEAWGEIRERIASSIYKQGEMAQTAGDLEGAVGHFLRVAQVVPDASIRETAEYDAAAALITLQAWDRAGVVLEAFRRDYPESVHADEVTRRLAVVYMESGRQEQAAGEFIRIADATDASPEMQREALWQAADLYETTGRTADERTTLESIVQRFPVPVPEAIEARQRLAEIAADGGDAFARRRWLEDIVQADALAGAARTERTRYLAAKASLELAEPKRQSFAALRLTHPLKQSLAAKKAVMEELLTAYGRAADYGVAEVTTAATFRIAEVYNQFSRDLLDSERPADLDADALEQYDILLEEQAFPFEEKSIELHEANAARASDGVYDDWVRRSFEQLAQLMPARYAKSEKTENALSALY